MKIDGFISRVASGGASSKDKCPISKADRRMPSEPSGEDGHLTIAQCIRRSSNPHHAAITSFTRRDVPHGSEYHTYYFEDRSVLVFKVTYDAVEDFQG